METKFKIGDRVYLFDARNCYTAELNKIYTIFDIQYDHWHSCTKIAFLENVSDSNDIQYLDARRFRKDIKIIRKLKLKEIFKNEEKI